MVIPRFIRSLLQVLRRVRAFHVLLWLSFRVSTVHFFLVTFLRFVVRVGGRGVSGRGGRCRAFPSTVFL